jgi:hypothetical protein
VQNRTARLVLEALFRKSHADEIADGYLVAFLQGL